MSIMSWERKQEVSYAFCIFDVLMGSFTQKMSLVPIILKLLSIPKFPI